jgi:hypothetical protein
LAAEGRLTPVVREELATRLSEHVTEFETQVSSTPAPELSVATRGDFEATLEAHADVLEHIAEEADDDERDSLSPVIAVVRERAERIAREHEKMRDELKNGELARVVEVRKEDARRKLALVDTSQKSKSKNQRSRSVENGDAVAMTAEATAMSFALAVANEPETPEQVFARGESEFENKSFAPALVAFDEVARSSERTRVRREREEKVRPLLAQKSERRSAKRDENKSDNSGSGKRKEENRDEVPTAAATSPSAATMMAMPVSTTTGEGTVTATTSVPVTPYPHEEEKDD